MRSIHDECCPLCTLRHPGGDCAPVRELAAAPVNVPVPYEKSIGGFSIYGRWCARHGLLHGDCDEGSV